MPLPRLESCDVKNKRVLLVADFKAPEARQVDPLRVAALIPTIELLLNRGAAVLVGTHLGLQLNEESNHALLENIARELEQRTNQQVRIIFDPFTGENKQRLRSLPAGGITLLDNLQNYPEESSGDGGFAKMLAGFVDVLVNDSFHACLSPYASTVALPRLITACSGLVLFREVDTFRNLFKSNQKPYTMIVGGVDIARKIKIIRKSLEAIDTLLIGGGIAYTFLKSRAVPIGNSVFEGDFQVDAFQTLERAEMAETRYQLPVDHVVAEQFSRQAKTKQRADIPDRWQAMDIGPKTLSLFEKVIKKSGTVFWYGPLGVVEFETFAKGTEQIARILKKSKARTVVTGESCLKVLDRLALTDQMSHVSQSSRAACELLLGSPLPGVQALESRGV